MRRLYFALPAIWLAVALSACSWTKYTLLNEDGPYDVQPAQASSRLTEKDAGRAMLAPDAAAIARLPVPAGVDAARWRALTAALVRVLAARSTSSAAKRLTAAQFTVNDYAILGRSGDNMTVSWTYRNPGDYDQNGEVNAADLLPVARYLHHTSASPDWPAAQVADGNTNGEVELGDVSVLGQNYRNAISCYALLADWGDADHNGLIQLSDIATYAALGGGSAPGGGNGRRWPDGSQPASPAIFDTWNNPAAAFALNQPPAQLDNTPGPYFLWRDVPLSAGQLPAGGGRLTFTVTQRVYIPPSPAQPGIVKSVVGFWTAVAPYNVPQPTYFELGNAGNAVRVPAS